MLRAIDDQALTFQTKVFGNQHLLLVVLPTQPLDVVVLDWKNAMSLIVKLHYQIRQSVHPKPQILQNKWSCIDKQSYQQEEGHNTLCIHQEHEDSGLIHWEYIYVQLKPSQRN